MSELTLWFVFKTLLLDLAAPEAELLPKANLTSLSLWPALVGDPQIFDRLCRNSLPLGVETT